MNQNRPINSALCLLAALSLTVASAIERIPGSQTYYSKSRDAITDVNTSSIVMAEVNDTTSDTLFGLKCSSFGRPELWAWMSSKHQMMSDDEYEMGVKPAVTIRLGNDAPIVLSNSDLTTVVDSKETRDNQAIGLTSAITRRIVNGLNAGKRLVVRVNRASGGQALTYTYSANGFSTAWSMIGACGGLPGSSGASTPAPVQAAPTPTFTGGTAPKFTRWYFTTCRDASSGAVRTGLTAGRAHLCDLVIETIPNGAQPISADFRYELEYREGNQTGKLVLDSVDTWPYGSGTKVKFRQSGNQLIFTLPLNVRARPERVYTSINVTANVQFSNGSSKKVYEPLPVRPAY